MAAKKPLIEPHIVAVGSTNPVKVGAVRAIVQKAWPQAQVIPLEIKSGVSAMPMSDEECIAGARNRAREALLVSEADIGIGLEGGVNEDPQGLMLLGWVVAIDRNDRQGVGGGARLPLPKRIARRVRQGEELGPLMDELLGQNNVKQRGGAVGALTNGLILRKQTFEIATAYALAPFVSPEFYFDE